MAASFPASNPSNSTLWVAANFLSNTLDGGHDNSTNVITVLDASSFPTSGYITVDTEVIKYTGTTGTTFTGCTRGADGTSNAAHSTGATVYHNWVADHHNVLKDEIIAIATNLTNRIGGHATVVKVPDGTVTNPSIAFQDDTNLGFYRIGADNAGVSANGAKVMEWDAYGVALIAGTVTNPSVHITGDGNTGIYQVAADNLGISAGGVLAIQVEDPADLDATEVSLRVYVKDESTLRQVTCGADDSGGAGFKLLRVPN